MVPNRGWRLLPLLLLALSMVAAVPLFSATDDYVVRNFTVTDMPFDGGNGVKLSWTPIKPIGPDGQPHPENAGIIEYRIYRGVSADSLFFLGKVSVNVKTGVVSDSMFYYDSGIVPFIDVESPLNLSVEQEETNGVTLYSRMPRDLEVTGNYFDNYQVLARLSLNQLFYNTERIEETTTGPDGTPKKDIYAGFKVFQAPLYCQLMVGSTYYYTVVPVSQTRKFYPFPEPLAITPRDNPPEAPQADYFYSAWVSDTNRLNLEWGDPTYSDDLAANLFYMVKQSDYPAFSQWADYQKAMAAIAAGAELEQPEQVDNPGIMIAQESGNQAVVELDPQIDTNALDTYYLVWTFADRNGWMNFSQPRTIDRTITSADLPVIPQITVVDKANDNGSTNTMYWGKPVVYLSKFTFMDEHTLRANYEYVTNQDYHITNIYVEVYDQDGKLVAEHNEFYQDNIFKLHFADDVDIRKGLVFKITLACDGELLADYEFEQAALYNESTMSMVPDKLYMHAGDQTEALRDWQYLMFRKNKIGSWSQVNKLSGVDREYDDAISYDAWFYRMIRKCNIATQTMYTEPIVDIGFDETIGTTITTSIFKEDANQVQDNLKSQIAPVQAQLDSLQTVAAGQEEVDPQLSAQIERLSARVESVNKRIEAINNYQPLQEANKLGQSARIHALAKNRASLRRSYAYKIGKTDRKAAFAEGEPIGGNANPAYFMPIPNWFMWDRVPMVIATIVFGALVFIMVRRAKRGDDLYIRPIAGIQEIDNAIGRATEMGRPILFQPGLSDIRDVATLAGLAILGRVAKKAAEYDTRILVPVRDYIVLPIAQEIVREAHYEAGRPDTYDKNSVFFITTEQFAFVAGVNGVMIREQTATNFYMGMFWAESLIMTETGNTTGAIQIAGTDAVSQIPFFITTCDYTLIGEELYAASAYLAREPMILGALKAQDFFKFLILSFIILGTVLSTARITYLLEVFPDK